MEQAISEYYSITASTEGIRKFAHSALTESAQAEIFLP